MVRSSDFSRRSCHCFAAWQATYLVGVLALALGGCGLDRSGLTMILVGDGGSPGKGDAAEDRTGGGTGGNNGSGGAIVGTGGDSGAGGGIIVDGSGGITGGGGSGTGGTIVGSGGIGAGGMIVGTGGIGAGGMIVGTGGIGAGGTIVGTGGIGAGGMIVGTGGSPDGGSDAGTGGAGTDGSGPDGSPGLGGSGAGGMGVGGAPGLGGMGPPPVCVPTCGPCQRCNANHMCELDPASKWDLAAIAAGVKSVDPGSQNGTNWDGSSGEIGNIQPDPFVEFDILTTAITPVGHTTPIIDTFFPNWGALMPPTQALLNPPGSPLLASDLLAGGKHWQIIVGDDDVDTDTGPFGETICSIFDPLTSADFLNGGFIRNDVGSCISVSIKLTCHP